LGRSIEGAAHHLIDALATLPAAITHGAIARLGVSVAVGSFSGVAPARRAGRPDMTASAGAHLSIR